MCYLHIKQIAISQERIAIWKNYRWSSLSFQEFFQIRQTLNFHFIYTLNECKRTLSHHHLNDSVYSTAKSAFSILRSPCTPNLRIKGLQYASHQGHFASTVLSDGQIMRLFWHVYFCGFCFCVYLFTLLKYSTLSRLNRVKYSSKKLLNSVIYHTSMFFSYKMNHGISNVVPYTLPPRVPRISYSFIVTLNLIAGIRTLGITWLPVSLGLGILLGIIDTRVTWRWSSRLARLIYATKCEICKWTFARMIVKVGLEVEIWRLCISAARNGIILVVTLKGFQNQSTQRKCHFFG